MVVTYFRAAPNGVHVCFSLQTPVNPSESSQFVAWSSHFFFPVPSSTRSVPDTPLLQCWSVLWWRLDPCCMMRALCIVLWLHVFPPHLNTLVWPLPKVSVTVSYNNYFTRYAVCLNNFWNILHSICNFFAHHMTPRYTTYHNQLQKISASLKEHMTYLYNIRHSGIQHMKTNCTTYETFLSNIWPATHATTRRILLRKRHVNQGSVPRNNGLNGWPWWMRISVSWWTIFSNARSSVDQKRRTH